MPPLTPRRVLVALLALAVVGWGVERLVVTDGEAIEALLERAAGAVSHDDWDGFAGAISDDYAGRGRDKSAFVAFVRRLKEQTRPQGVGVDVADTKVEGDRAATHVVVRPGPPYLGTRIGGRVDLVRTKDGWRITGVTEDETSFLGR